MPKPTADEIFGQMNPDAHNQVSCSIAASRISRLINAWEAEMEAQRESVWHSFHRAWTACVGTARYDKAPWRECAKQVGDVVGTMGHAGTECGTDHAKSTSPEGGDMEQYNHDQRIRREAYEEALRHQGHAVPQERATAAASRYPLRKRVPRVIDDPHASVYAWRLNPEFTSEVGTRIGECFEIRFSPEGGWHANEHPALLTPQRVRALAALLDDPYMWEEDPSVEEGT